MSYKIGDPLPPAGNPAVRSYERAKRKSERLDPMNPELNEATAVAIVQILDNQIAALQAWKRKLTRPFMPTMHYVHMQVPAYPKPTMQMVIHIANTFGHGRSETLRIGMLFDTTEVNPGDA